MSLETQHQYASITAAADLIRTIDSAFSDMSSCAISATKQAEDARKNARAASELVRLFSSHNSTRDDVSKLMEKIPVFHSASLDSFGTNTEQPVPPPPPSSAVLISGKMSVSGMFKNSNQSNVSIDETIDDDPLIPSPSRRRSRGASSSERLAKAHAEDLLSMTLELEKVKRDLEREQMLHDETKSVLTRVKSKNSQSEALIDKLLNDMETLREDNGRKMDRLSDELAHANFRVKAAEEDAQVALDLAKENADNRAQLETWLQRALDEIKSLKENITILQASPSPSAPTFADQDSISSKYFSPGKSMYSSNYSARPSTLMVSQGRNLMKNSFNRNSYNGTSPKSVSQYIQEAADHSRSLRCRLTAFGTNTEVDWTGSNGDENLFVTRRTKRQDLGSAVEALDVCRDTADIIKESGKKLNLTGRWFTGPTQTILDELHLEALAQHYCTAVEVELSRKHKEIQELESLCSVWEEGISHESSRLESL